jgi:Sec-independent protein translocase protein TatA
LPELAKGLGNGIREFKKATSNASEDVRQAIEAPQLTVTRRLPAVTADTEDAGSQITSAPKV